MYSVTRHTIKDIDSRRTTKRLGSLVARVVPIDGLLFDVFVEGDNVHLYVEDNDSEGILRYTFDRNST